MAIKLAIAHYKREMYEYYAEFFRAHPKYDIQLHPPYFTETELLNARDLPHNTDALILHAEMKGFSMDGKDSSVAAARLQIKVPVVIIAVDQHERISDFKQIAGPDLVYFEYDGLDLDVLATRIVNLVRAKANPAAAPSVAPPAAPPVSAPIPPQAAPIQAPKAKPQPVAPVREAAEVTPITRVSLPEVATPASRVSQAHGTFVVMGVAGGVGATTIAYHLARVLVGHDNRVCLTDARYPRSTLLDILPTTREFVGQALPTAYAFANQRAHPNPREDWRQRVLPIEMVIPGRKGQLAIIPSAMSDDQLGELSQEPEYAGFYTDLCTLLSKQFTYNIVLVGPDPLFAFHYEALAAANRVIIVTTQHAPYYQRLTNLIDLVGAKFHLRDANIDVIVNRYDPQLPLRKQDFESRRIGGARLLRTVGDYRLELERRDYASVNHAEVEDGKSSLFEDDILGIAGYFETGIGTEIPIDQPNNNKKKNFNPFGR